MVKRLGVDNLTSDIERSSRHKDVKSNGREINQTSCKSVTANATLCASIVQYLLASKPLPPSQPRISTCTTRQAQRCGPEHLEQLGLLSHSFTALITLFNEVIDNQRAQSFRDSPSYSTHIPDTVEYFTLVRVGHNKSTSSMPLTRSRPTRATTKCCANATVT